MMPIWPHGWEDAMSSKFDEFRGICDSEFGFTAGQEKIDIEGIPYGYRYDFCLANLPCFISFDYKTDDIVGCVWFNGYAFARKTRCVVADYDVPEMIRQMRIIQCGLTEFAIEPETYSTSPDYDSVGIWSAHKSNMVIDDYVRINEHDAVCAGLGYSRMPLQQIVDNSESEPAPKMEPTDNVNAPKHYAWLGSALSKQVENVGDVEVFHVLMAAFDKEPLLWQVGKYLLRAGRKDDRKQDLEKARWYLDKAIES